MSTQDGFVIRPSGRDCCLELANIYSRKLAKLRAVAKRASNQNTAPSSTATSASPLSRTAFGNALHELLHSTVRSDSPNVTQKDFTASYKGVDLPLAILRRRFMMAESDSRSKPAKSFPASYRAGGAAQVIMRNCLAAYNQQAFSILDHLFIVSDCYDSELANQALDRPGQYPKILDS